MAGHVHQRAELLDRDGQVVMRYCNRCGEHLIANGGPRTVTFNLVDLDPRVVRLYYGETFR